MGYNLKRKYFDPLTKQRQKRWLAVPVFLITCLEMLIHSFSVLFHPAHKSFARESIRCERGVFQESYHHHKNRKSGARYFAVSTLMVLLAAGLLVHLVVFSFFPNGIQPALAASSFTVNDLGDGQDANPGDGVCEVNVGLLDCTLRAAIEETNADISGTPHNISFSVSGMIFVGPATAIPLPALTNNDTNINVPTGQQIILNGTRFIANGSGIEVQADNCDITADDFGGLRIVFFPDHGIATVGAANTAIQNVWLGTMSGGTSEPNTNGIDMDAASSVINIQDVVASGNSGNGLNLEGLGFLIVDDSFIGSDNTGANANGNHAHGIYVTNGNLTLSDSVVSGNTQNGILMESGNAIIFSNFIGTDLGGSNAVNNGESGLKIDGGSVIIGGSPNVISGNSNYGIDIDNVTSATISNNFIGTNSIGAAAIPNGDDGIYVRTNANNVTIDNNCISGNTQNGIRIRSIDAADITDNRIGTNNAGNAALGNGRAGIEHRDTPLNLDGNTISANGASANQNGVNITNGTNHTITNNNIGTDITGSADLGNDRYGLYIAGANTATVSGNTVSANGGRGIDTTTNSNLDFYDNFIGTDSTGASALPNDYGLYLTACTNCNVGAPAQGNVISGNASENLHVDASSGITIQSNMIGTNAAGNAAIAGNGNGVLLFDDPGTQVGGSAANERNVVSGNSTAIGLWQSDNSVIENNYIGVGADGSTPIANTGFGIAVGEQSDSTSITENIIYGANVGIGIGPYFGGTLSKYVTISENSIYGNNSTGIYLEPGANESIQPPEIYDISYDSGTDTYDIYVNTSLSGATIELFWDANGQGRTYKASKVSASAVVFENIPGPMPAGYDFTVTQTNSNGSTSIFAGPDSSPPNTTADPAGGTYNTPITVTLVAKDNADPAPTIYYTTDGSNPTIASDSCAGTCDIDIVQTTTLKFFAIDSMGNIEAVNTEEYIISTNPSGISLKISNVAAQNIGSTHADIVWDTNKYSNSKVYYGKTVAMNKTQTNSSYVLDHEINLTGLEPNTTYYYQVESNTALETAKSAVGTFTTFKKEIDPPVITAPADGAHYFTLYMTHNDKNIEVEMQNPVLTDGKNKVYVDDKKQKNKKNNKKFAEIGSDGKSEFDIGVKNNNDVARNDGHKIEADAVNISGNTSAKSDPVSFAMGSTHSSGTISFAPTVAERPADMVNTTLVSQPTIASYFPGVAGAQVLVYKKSTADSGYVLDGTTGASGDPAGIMNFAYKFFLPQPPGTISVYFEVKDGNGVVQYTSEPFSLVYYKGCPATWQGAVVDVQTTYNKPWMTFLMCHTQEYEIFLDGTFNGSGTAPATASGTASIAYLPFLPLSDGQHSVKIRTFESYGYPYSDTTATFDVTPTGYGGGGGGTPAPPAPAPEPEPEPEPEPVVEPEPDTETPDKGDGQIGTKKVVKLTPAEIDQLKKELTESLEKNTRVIINIGGVIYEGELVDGLMKFCIKKCLYPSLSADQKIIELSGELDLSEELSKKLNKAGAEANTQLIMGDTVQIAKVNKTGEWSITVPLSELPEGEVDARVTASTNGVDSDEVTVAKFQAQTEPAISNTSILIFANLALAAVFLLIGGIVYQRRKRQQ